MYVAHRCGIATSYAKTKEDFRSGYIVDKSFIARSRILLISNDSQECYGIADDEKVNRVMQVYDEIGLQNTFSIYDQETYNLLNTHIQQISRGLPHDIFLQLLKLVSKRQMEK